MFHNSVMLTLYFQIGLKVNAPPILKINLTCIITLSCSPPGPVTINNIISFLELFYCLPLQWLNQSDNIILQANAS